MPLNSITVAGLILNRIGTNTVAPNMANRCWKLSGMVCSKGGRSLTPMTRRVIVYILCKSHVMLWLAGVSSIVITAQPPPRVTA